MTSTVPDSVIVTLVNCTNRWLPRTHWQAHWNLGTIRNVQLGVDPDELMHCVRQTIAPTLARHYGDTVRPVILKA